MYRYYVTSDRVATESSTSSQFSNIKDDSMDDQTYCGYFSNVKLHKFFHFSKDNLLKIKNWNVFSNVLLFWRIL